MVRIGLVSCVKRKASSPTLARDLYTSPYFRKMRAHVEATCDDWRILSALHGVVHPAQVLAPYERTLKDIGRAERRAWAQDALARLHQAFPEPKSVTFEIHGGREYTQGSCHIVRDFCVARSA